MYTSAVIIFFSGLTYAAVPLYRLFCSATGFAGTPQVGVGKFDPERLVPVDEARRIKVHFNASRSDQLPWSFLPEQKFVTVLPGETSLAFYKAKNISPQDIIGIATYNVTPDRVKFRHHPTEITRKLKPLYPPGRSVFLKSRMFLFRGTEAISRRGGRYASPVLHRQGHPRRPRLQEYRRRRPVIHILQVRNRATPKPLN